MHHSYFNIFLFIGEHTLLFLMPAIFCKFDASEINSSLSSVNGLEITELSENIFA